MVASTNRGKVAKKRRRAGHPKGKAPEVIGPIEAADDPHRLGRLILAKKYDHPDGPTLHSWRGEWWRWSTARACYRCLPETDLRAEISKIIKAELDRANVAEQQAQGPLVTRPPVAKKVTTALVSNVLQAIASEVIIPAETDQPAWLGDDPPFSAAEALPCRNALVHLPGYVENLGTYKVDPTPRFFAAHALDYDFDPEAPAPLLWIAFLAQLWGDDRESIEALQEWMGLHLIVTTKYQKILALIGPKRAGKGMIARVLTAMIGPANVCGQTLSGLTGSFGLQPLLGKTAVIISDARLTGRSDAGIVIERLLAISGEGSITVDRKHSTPQEVRLSTLFTIVSNELPYLPDQAGAMDSRFLVLRLVETFYGREDHDLIDKLLAELPGILLWAVAGWDRLHKRARFVQPDSSRELVEQMAELTSPVGAFVRECCDVGPEHEVSFSALFQRWERWCEANGRSKVGTKALFGRNLHAAVPALKTTQPCLDGRRERFYEGIGLRESTPGAEDRA